jgi:predicted Holliday junction resolvase-like endonuclease
LSLIFSSFITFVLILSILSLVNKFEAISLQFKSEKMQLVKKQFKDQNEKKLSKLVHVKCEEHAR